MSLIREPRSRRDRPAKQSLSRQWIIDETLTIMRREGLQKATMRRVAQALDTGPASLYVYFANTAELHAAVIDELVRPLRAGEDGSWRQRLKTLVTQYRDLLFAQPGLARSALVVRPSGPNLLALFDQLMGLLIEGGVEPASAGWGVDLLLQMATATAAEHASPEPGDVDAGGDADRSRDPAEQQRASDAAVRTTDAATTPNIAAHADAVVGGSSAERWDWALETLIVGIAGSARPTS